MDPSTSARRSDRLSHRGLTRIALIFLATAVFLLGLNFKLNLYKSQPLETKAAFTKLVKDDGAGKSMSAAALSPARESAASLNSTLLLLFLASLHDSSTAVESLQRGSTEGIVAAPFAYRPLFNRPPPSLS
jgi:hypothetical protein